MKHFQILAIAGSLRKESYNSAALHAAQQLAPGTVQNGHRTAPIRAGARQRQHSSPLLRRRLRRSWWRPENLP